VTPGSEVMEVKWRGLKGAGEGIETSRGGGRSSKKKGTGDRSAATGRMKDEVRHIGGAAAKN